MLKQHWSKNDASGNMEEWFGVELDLSEYKGKTIQLQWSFGSTTFGPQGEGIYVDDVKLEATCEDTGGKGGPEE
jgi:bacillopeptidase F (M6 metalloprotease family)